MKRKYPILLIAWAMWPGVARADLKSTLTSKLIQYCIPKDTTGCTYKANYTGTGCVCPTGGRYYSTINRRCDACSAGTYALPNTASCTDCPGPTSCPAGTYKADITGGCPAGTYAVTVADCGLTTGTGGGPDTCPSGNYKANL
jgi:hypothetical protein